MNHSLLVAEFLSTPWALMPERLNAMSRVVHRWSVGVPASDYVREQVQADQQLRQSRRQALAASASVPNGGIAVLPLYGVITQRGNMVDDISGPGCTSTQQFAAALRQALADDAVQQILIDIDSPGGNVYGIAELADEITSSKNVKPIIAIANSLAASAAYWIGACASQLYVTASGEVGSIGVWQAHFDHSQELAAEGIKPTLVSAGKFKTEGNPYMPLDEEALAFMQSRVDEYYSSFIKAIAKGRGVPLSQVRDSMGQGRVLGADAALAQNMVDGIASFDEVLKKMQREAKASASKQTKPGAVLRLAQMRRELQLL
jgi:capsid assembly protease